MLQNPNSKLYDLEGRTLKFAEKIRDYVKLLPKTISNTEYGKQLIRSSGSVAANYIEANEALSKKDFILRVKISKKESKESRLWIALSEPITGQLNEKQFLIKEVNELMKIFGSIIEKSTSNK